MIGDAAKPGTMVGKPQSCPDPSITWFFASLLLIAQVFEKAQNQAQPLGFDPSDGVGSRAEQNPIAPHAAATAAQKHPKTTTVPQPPTSNVASCGASKPRSLANAQNTRRKTGPSASVDPSTEGRQQARRQPPTPNPTTRTSISASGRGPGEPFPPASSVAPTR